MTVFNLIRNWTIQSRTFQKKNSLQIVMLIFNMVIFATLSDISDVYAQTSFEKHPHPVLEPGSVGSWDTPHISASSIIILDDMYHMWYSGGNIEGTGNAIGHATSVDGILWTKDTLNPVLTKGPGGSWDQYDVLTPSVLLVDSIFHMWYTGHSTTAGNAGWLIGHATSPDGRIWTKDTLNPVLNVGPAGSWDARWLFTGGSVVKIDTTYHIWYSAWDGVAWQERVRIGHATSSDGRIWIKDPANPVLSRGSSNDWDYRRVEAPNVFYDGESYHMFYTGGEYFDSQIGYAHSNDGSTWDKYSENPVLGLGAAESWDALDASYCSVIFDSADSLYKMWYTGAKNSDTTKIGYATSPSLPAGIDEHMYIDIPEDYVLSQNYPNPFNPSTTIEFTLPKSEFVELKVYNILGKEVTTLVSNKLNQGNHTYQFDGKNLASGIYYYQLVAGNFREVKKMILLR